MERQTHSLDTEDRAAKPQGLSLQTIRHELRTPVNHIIGYSEMLLEETAELAHGEHYDQLQTIVAAGRSMLSLISEHLSGPDVETRPIDLAGLHLSLVPLIASVTQICNDLEQVAEQEGEATFAADLAKISTAAVHLGELAAGSVKAVHGALHLGEPPATGSSPGVGSPDIYQTGSLLLVDDNRMNREMLERRLVRMGYQVTQAENGRRALELLDQQSFDLVLLDIMMPELDGYGVLGTMRGDSKLQRIPVIVLSALDDMESVVRAIELGADDYLPKPFDPVLLKARIGTCLFKKRLNDLESEYLKRIEDEKRRADDLLHVVIPIGVALSVEKDFNQLLERIVLEAQALCSADGGTLYLRTDDNRLRFVIARNRSLNLAMGGAGGKDIPFAPLRLYDEQSGAPNFNYAVAHAALTGDVINIPDAYNADGYDFSGTRDFDSRTGYRSTSLLNIPLKDGLNRVIGVLQLINAQDATGQVIPFDQVAVQMLESLGKLAAAALSAYTREQQLRQEIADLKIEIDHVKKQRDVEKLTSTAFFGNLQERARQLRNGAGERESPATEEVVASDENGRRRPGEPERKIYLVDGQPIYGRELGQSTRRLLLMIHGWSSSWYALSPLLSSLSERYRCVAVDLPGYGDSPPLTQRASITAYADLLADLIRQLSPDQPAVLLGHSMGGMISLTMALRHPELIERMVLLGPTISGNLSFWINTFISPITMLERSRLANRAVAALEPFMLSMTDRLMRPASFAERTGISEQDYQRLRADARRPGQGRVRAECFWAMRESDLRGKLTGVTVPSLVIWGMEDNTVPLRDASIVADEWPQAELRVLPKAGHWPQFETPDLTRRYIRSFLSTPIKLLRARDLL